MSKLEKSPYLNSIFLLNYTRYKKTFLDNMYILCFGFKKTLLEIKKFHFQQKYVRYEISVKLQNRLPK